MAEEKTTFTEQVGNEIERLAGADVTPPSPQQESPSSSPATPERKCVRASDLLRRNVTELPKLFAPVFPAVGLSILGGESDACKSMLLRNMAICTVTGRDFLGWKYQGTRKSCIFVSTEDDEDATSYLLGKHNATFTDYADDWGGLRFIFANEDTCQTLDNELTAEPADLVVIYAYSDVFDGKEQNSAAQVRDFINPFKALAKKHQCHIIFLHHTGKGKEDYAPSKNNFIGSQSLEAAVRLGIELRVDKSNPNLRHLCIVKGNYLGSHYKGQSFVLRMDENFVFYNTGERVPFDELGNPDVNRAGRKSKDVTKISDEDYINAFDEIFKDGKLRKNNLKTKLRNVFNSGSDVVERMIVYAEEKGWIENVSTNPNRCEYERK